MNVVSSTSHLNHSWNRSRIQFNSIDSMLPQQRKITYQCVNMKRKEIRSSITMEKKKHKRSIESPSFVLVCGQNICGQLGLSTNIPNRGRII